MKTLGISHHRKSKSFLAMSQTDYIRKQPGGAKAAAIRTSASHPRAPEDDTVAHIRPTELQHRISCIDHQPPSDTSAVADLTMHICIVRIHLLRHEVLHTSATCSSHPSPRHTATHDCEPRQERSPKHSRRQQPQDGGPLIGTCPVFASGCCKDGTPW